MVTQIQSLLGITKGITRVICLPICFVHVLEHLIFKLDLIGLIFNLAYHEASICNISASEFFVVFSCGTLITSH